MESYRVVKPLGQGSFGKCYLVEARSTRSLCVLKQIDVRMMSEEEKQEAIREALILRELDHPNIIKFRDAYLTKRGRLSIVMDYADGGDLQAKIQQQHGKFFKESQILDWFVQICLGLKHIHDRKILHRDLKTQNIFLSKNGRVKLGDFGIAKVLDKTSDNSRTMVGTPYYLSPEIIESRPYNFKSDIWSLGVMLYEMCSLKPPFDACSLHFLALKIVRGVFPPLPSVFSRDLKNLLGRMLSVDPHRRPSIHKILQEPLVKRRISHFLSKSVRANEFSHTILHNFNLWRNEPPSGSSEEPSVIEEPPAPVPKSEPQEPPVPFQAWGEEEVKKEMLQSIRARKSELAGRNDSEKEEEENLYNLEEALLEEEGDEPEYEAPVVVAEVPPPRDDEVVEDEEPPEAPEPVPVVESYDKIEALKMYLEEHLGLERFLSAYNIVRNVPDAEDIGFNHYYPHLKHLMSREDQIQYLPLIQTLLDLEGVI